MNTIMHSVQVVRTKCQADQNLTWRLYFVGRTLLKIPRYFKKFNVAVPVNSLNKGHWLQDLCPLLGECPLMRE
jgi:hypothetical protein